MNYAQYIYDNCIDNTSVHIPPPPVKIEEEIKPIPLRRSARIRANAIISSNNAKRFYVARSLSHTCSCNSGIICTEKFIAS